MRRAAEITASITTAALLAACGAMPQSLSTQPMLLGATPSAPLVPSQPSPSPSPSPPAAAAAAAAAIPGPSSEVAGQPNQRPATANAYTRLTNFLIIDPVATGSSNRKAWIGGTYTRLLIRGDLKADGKADANGELVSPDGGKPMKYEPRHWLTRALLGKESATNFSLLFKVDTHEQVASLVTIGRQSNTQGEKWERVISHSDYSFPYFLVRNDGTSSTPKLTFKLKSDNTYQSQGFAAALTVALQVADKLVNEPQVVNSLASTSSREKAKAADAAISQLFGTSVVEQHTTDRDLAGTPNSHRFTMGMAGVTISLRLPTKEGDYTADPIPVGTWHVGFDDPKPSIFSPVRICMPAIPAEPGYCIADETIARKRVADNLAASEVLAFLLTPPPGAPITAEGYLRMRPYFQSSIPLFASADRVTQLRAYDSFCQNVVNDIVKLGLNDFDGRAVLWAVVKGMPDVVMARNIPADSSCKKMLADFPA